MFCKLAIEYNNCEKSINKNTKASGVGVLIELKENEKRSKTKDLCPIVFANSAYIIRILVQLVNGSMLSKIV